MLTAKSMKLGRTRKNRTSQPAQTLSNPKTIIEPDSLQKERVHLEAARRAAFVHGMGAAVAGYCDGYADGFEHAISWLLDPSVDLLALDYRAGSGMKSAKDYYNLNPNEKVKILEWFRGSTVKSSPQK